MFLGQFFPFLLLAVLPGLHAYKIDRSCDKYRGLLKTSIDSAVSNARRATEALEKSPRDGYVQKLVNHLFIGSAKDPKQKDLAKVLESFKGIVKDAGTEVTRDIAPTNSLEVIFYCTVDHLQPRGDSLYYHERSGTVMQNLCESKINLAFTWTPNPAEAENKFAKIGAGPAFPSEIIMCPWFLEWATDKAWRTFGGFFSLGTLARGVIPVVASPIGAYDEVDRVALLDKVILHELTHTVAGGSSVDVKNDAIKSVVYPKVAYGWKNCKILADANEQSVFNSGINNADSRALFAHGVRLAQEQPPWYIKDDGGLTRMQPPSKRAVNVTIDERSEQDGFLTVVRDERQIAEPTTVAATGSY